MDLPAVGLAGRQATGLWLWSRTWDSSDKLVLLGNLQTSCPHWQPTQPPAASVFTSVLPKPMDLRGGGKGRGAWLSSVVLVRCTQSASVHLLWVAEEVREGGAMNVPGRQPICPLRKPEPQERQWGVWERTSSWRGWDQVAWVWVPSLLLTPMNSGKWLSLYVPQFPHPHNGGSTGTYFIELLGWNEVVLVKQLKQCQEHR